MDMQQLIIKELFKQSSKDLDTQELVQKFKNYSIEDACHLFFGNYRSKSKGVKLSSSGVSVLKLYYKSYEIRIPKHVRILNKHLLFLDRFLKFPYYLKRSSIILFDGTDAFNLKMVKGDLDLLIEMFDKNKIKLT